MSVHMSTLHIEYTRKMFWRCQEELSARIHIAILDAFNNLLTEIQDAMLQGTHFNMQNFAISTDGGHSELGEWYTEGIFNVYDGALPIHYEDMNSGNLEVRYGEDNLNAFALIIEFRAAYHLLREERAAVVTKCGPTSTNFQAVAAVLEDATEAGRARFTPGVRLLEDGEEIMSIGTLSTPPRSVA